MQFRNEILVQQESIFLKPITNQEIIRITKELKNKHSSGIDGIPTSIIKYCVEGIKEILCYVINNSLTYGIFPENLKMAQVKPIYKKGDPGNMTNYRPISLLPGFSKLFERTMCDRLVGFMTLNE